MIYWLLFISFLTIGACSFGGGYAAMPLIQSQIVDLHQWISYKEFTDLITISQMTPGPIAVNGATFVGIKVAGIPGAIIATLGVILPSCLIVSIITYFYMKYRHLSMLQEVLKVLRPAVVSLIATAGVSIIISAFFKDGIIGLSTINIQMIFIFMICLYLLIKKEFNPILVMILAGVLNVCSYYIIML